MPIDLWTGKRFVHTCSCGSEQRAHAEYDARGIFLCFACDDCRKEKLSHFRKAVLNDPFYDHIEPIDAD